MGEGRSMGKSWIAVAIATLAEDEALGAWIDVALSYNEQMAGGDR